VDTIGKSSAFLNYSVYSGDMVFVRPDRYIFATIQSGQEKQMERQALMRANK